MDQELHWIFLTGIEAGRLEQEALHFRPFGSGKPERLERLHGHLGQYSIVQMAKLVSLEIYMTEWLLIHMRILLRIHSSYRDLVDFIGRLNGHASKDQGLTIRRKHQIVIRTTGDFLYRIVQPALKTSLLGVGLG